MTHVLFALPQLYSACVRHPNRPHRPVGGSAGGRVADLQSTDYLQKMNFFWGGNKYIPHFCQISHLILFPIKFLHGVAALVGQGPGSLGSGVLQIFALFVVVAVRFGIKVFKIKVMRGKLYCLQGKTNFCWNLTAFSPFLPPLCLGVAVLGRAEGDQDDLSMANVSSVHIKERNNSPG